MTAFVHNSDMACSVAGITSDANVLTNELRLIAQRHLLQYGESIPCERLVSWLCDIKQAYTQYGGKRPFGVSILYMGWDKHYGFQLYQSDPSGNYSGWKATCIGNNSSAAVSLLKQEYKENETNLEQALALTVKVLSKTLDTTKLTGDKCKRIVIIVLSKQILLMPFNFQWKSPPLPEITARQRSRFCRRKKLRNTSKLTKRRRPRRLRLPRRKRRRNSGYFKVLIAKLLFPPIFSQMKCEYTSYIL